MSENCVDRKVRTDSDACPLFHVLLVALLGWPERDQRDIIDFLREENRTVVSPDGQRFLMIKCDETPGATRVVVVQDWTNELKAPMPVR